MFWRTYRQLTLFPFAASFPSPFPFPSSVPSPSSSMLTSSVLFSVDVVCVNGGGVKRGVNDEAAVVGDDVTFTEREVVSAPTRQRKKTQHIQQRVAHGHSRNP